jgi:hypothetical protein
MAEKLAPEKRHSFIHNGPLHLFDFGVSAIEYCVWGFVNFRLICFRSEGVRVGPDSGRGELVHRPSAKRSCEAILLQGSVEARRARHQGQPSVPQCLSLISFCFWFVFC